MAAVAAALLPGSASEPAVSLRPASAVEILGRAADTARAEDLHARNDQSIKVTSVDIVSGRRSERRLWVSVDGGRAGLLRTSPCQFRGGMATCDVRGVPSYQTAVVGTEVAGTLPTHRYLPERGHN